MKNIGKLSIWGSLILAINLNAAPISQEEAKNTAVNWMFEKSGEELTIDNSVLGATSNTSDAYRIIKLKPKGWVIVSSDDIAKPIIGYGTSELGNGNNPAFNSWMKGVEEQINSAKNSLAATSTKEQEEADAILDTWNKYKVTTQEFKNSNPLGATGADDFDYVVRPLLWLGSADNVENQGIQWSQGTYYNELTPIDDGYHTPVGCTATAMGQLMRYHQYPAQGTGTHSYTPSTHPEYGEQSANFGATTYDWASMPLKLGSENNAVAEVLYHIGVSVNMNYKPNGSGAWINTNDALKQFFSYDIASLIYRSGYENNEWHATIKNELNDQRPVEYNGFSEDMSSGHAFIIDGYDVDKFYHLNWGWGGYRNGKFVLDDLTPGSRNYSYNHSVAIVIPVDTSPIITISDENLRTCVMEALDVDNADDITQMKAKFLTYLNCNNKGILDITALQNLTSLNSLHLTDNQITDISILQNLTSLTSLHLSGNQIADITALQNLTSLTYLRLRDNQITDISALQNLTSLTYLNIGYNYITDFTPIDHLADDVVTGKDTQIEPPFIDTYEPNNDAEHATQLSNGITYHGIGVIGDEDWFKITVSSESEITLETNGTTGDTVMYVYDSSGTNQVGYNDDEGNGAFSLITQSFTPGTYYIKIIDYNNDGTINKYSMSISGLPEGHTRSDYDADGTSDIMMQHTNGKIWFYGMKNGKVVKSSVARHPSSAWKVVGSGDYDADGKSDILMQHTNGKIWFYGMNGHQALKSAKVVHPSPDWKVIGSGDYDGDGTSDILMQHTNGKIWFYGMKNGKVVKSSVARHPSANWKVVGSGDYDGDGKSDILMQHTNGKIWFYGMNGHQALKSAKVVHPSTDWKVIGSGDYDGDGTSDILMQHTNGKIWFYGMKNGKVVKSAVARHPSSDWKVVGSGDYDGDGKSDILMQHTNGKIWFYGMNGSQALKSSLVRHPSTDWKVVKDNI